MKVKFRVLNSQYDRLAYKSFIILLKMQPYSFGCTLTRKIHLFVEI